MHTHTHTHTHIHTHIHTHTHTNIFDIYIQVGVDIAAFMYVPTNAAQVADLVDTDRTGELLVWLWSSMFQREKHTSSQVRVLGSCVYM